MKKIPMKKFIPFLILSLISLSFCYILAKPEVNQSTSSHLSQPGALVSNVGGLESAFPKLKSPQADSLLLVQTVIDLMSQDQAKSASRFVMSEQEYKEFYPFLKTGSTKSKDASYIANIYLSGNKKHLNRWTGELTRMGVKRVVSVEFKSEIQPQLGFDLLKIQKITVEIESGELKTVEPFRTLIKTHQGFKIWSILDT